MITCSENNIRDIIDENTFVIVQFGKSFCSPCKQLKPKIEKLSIDNPSIIFAYVDIENTQDFCVECEVLSVPTTIAYYNSIEIGRVIGNNEILVKELIKKIYINTP
jgi:putative thioredoxin